ncbi:MAG: anti-sigma factor family protein [Stellaceae bacterium]
MPKRIDDRLAAYLDGEIEAAERLDIEAWLERDLAARERLAALAESAELVRRAFDEVLHEPVPPRLIAAARGQAVSRIAAGAEPGAEPGAELEAVTIAAGLPVRPRAQRGPLRRRWRLAVPLAASICGLLIGGSAAYLGVGRLAPGNIAGAGGQPTTQATLANNLWLDNAAGYFKLFVSAGDNALIELPAGSDPRAALQKISQSLPQQVRLPDLKPWGLNFRGARLIVVDGRPAAQLVYTTDNKAIGPLALIIGSSKQPDIPPTFDRRQDVNLIYWRHQGRAYALVGQANIGYLWGIGNDVAWQLDAI